MDFPLDLADTPILIAIADLHASHIDPSTDAGADAIARLVYGFQLGLQVAAYYPERASAFLTWLQIAGAARMQIPPDLYERRDELEASTLIDAIDKLLTGALPERVPGLQEHTHDK